MQGLEEIKNILFQYGLWYFAVVSVISVIVTVFDKISAKLHGRRIPEATLLLLFAIGGSAAMYLTMLIIRHKTRHIKFMAGIPFIIALQVITICCILKYA